MREANAKCHKLFEGFQKMVGCNNMEGKTREGSRVVLWVDAVGGYLVCLGDEVILGQAVPDADIEIPIFGDLSRRHLRIFRDGEGYLLEPLQKVLVNGKVVHTVTSLQEGAEVEVGQGVRLRFRRPHALSSTARLDFISQHRVSPTVDGILLMSDSLVMGPGNSSHIVCRDWEADLVLFRQGTDLFCRGSEYLEIDGRKSFDGIPIRHNSHLAGTNFAVSLEDLRTH